MNFTPLAKFISYLCIPPVMNFFIFVHISSGIEESPQNLYSILISFFLGLLFPVIAILYFRKRGILSDIDATIKEERTIPYIYAIFFSLAGVTISAFLELSVNIIMLWMVYVFISIIIININRFWKVSAHAIGVSIPVGTLYYINDYFWFKILLVVLILVGFSRLYLRVHTFFQVLVGSIIGFFVAFASLEYLL